MFSKIKNGSQVDVQGLICQLPPVGYVVNEFTGQLEKRNIISRSPIPSEQYWERQFVPDWLNKRYREEQKKRETDPAFFDTELKEYSSREWDRRLNGVWFMNNGEATYLTGLNYMFLQWWKMDVETTKFRLPDLEYYYFLQYCIEDPNCLGMLEVTKRRNGKTYRAGLFAYEGTSRTPNANSGIQSKTNVDGKKFFSKAVIRPFKALPAFFRPEYDLSGGITPKKELLFQQTNVRGKMSESMLDKVELQSGIDYQSSELLAYDGQKLQWYVRDECLKCFAKGTSIRMFDGSVKTVENIMSGELVMGDDSTARIVSGLAHGTENMYRIVPNSGEPWECNESHILSLKWANRADKFRGKSFGETVNISLRDYFTLSAKQKKHLMLWKVGVEYQANQHEMEPYFLGAWLGDGTSHRTGFSSEDLEIIEYMSDTAKVFGVELVQRSKYDYFLSGKAGIKGSNRLLSILQESDLIHNKHIPKDYMIDSMENRLELLAGLLDTDGTLNIKNGKPTRFAITQKRKELAYQIADLARSCGFKGSIGTHVAKMVREDGTIYQCRVYSVNIYGELYKIPCKVKRKKADNCDFHVNRRNCMRSGFHVEPIGKGEFFGFEVDKNHLFLLEDYTVVHNTFEVNVYDGLDVVNYCLKDDEGKIIGKALYTSTVEIEEEGKKGRTKKETSLAEQAAKQLWDDSDHLNKPGKETVSGLYRFFMPAYRLRAIDKYGKPNEDVARAEIMQEREKVKGNPKRLAALKRKEPLTISDAFGESGVDCHFNADYLKERIDVLGWTAGLKTEDAKELNGERGNYHWVGGIFDPSKGTPKVYWKADRNGRWIRWWDFEKPEMANNVEKIGNLFYPKNKVVFISGADPYENDVTEDTRNSQGSGHVFLRFDPNQANSEYSNSFVCEYHARPKKVSLFFDDMLKQSFYYGTKLLYENNKKKIGDFFMDNFCTNFLVKLEGYENFGIPSTPENKKMLVDLFEEYIEDNHMKLRSLRLCEDLLKFDVSRTQKFDLTMSAGWTLVANFYRRKLKPETASPKMEDYFRTYKVAN